MPVPEFGMNGSDAVRRIVLACDEARALEYAVRENGLLTEYGRIAEAERDAVGGLYAARVTEFLRAYGGCFAAVGRAADGGEIRGFLAGEERFRAGEWVLCQSVGEAHGNKEMRLSGHVKLTGVYLVLMLSDTTVGVSAKLRDLAVRTRLDALGRDMLQTAPAPFRTAYPDAGLIFRTEAAGAPEDVLRKEMTALLAWAMMLYGQFRTAVSQGNPCILEGPDPLRALLLRYPPSTVEAIVGDGGACLRAIEAIYPAFRGKTKLLRAPAMETDGVLRELTRLTGRRVYLPSGANLVIDYTEAMTVIDVNSGKMTGARARGELARRVNAEAAAEIMRQLRLRNLGGMILCDMIDMETEADRAELLAQMRKSAENDPVPVQVVDITPLGIVEITRKRTKEQKKPEFLDKQP